MSPNPEIPRDAPPSTSGDQDVRLSPRHLITVHAVACLLFMSGALAGLQDVLVLLGREEWLAPTTKTWALRVHGGSAMLFLVVVGTLLPTHVHRAWNTGRNRVSGVALIIILALLTVSGYGLYYFGGEFLRGVTQWFHLGLGIIDPFLLIAHIVMGRASRRKPTAP